MNSICKPKPELRPRAHSVWLLVVCALGVCGCQNFQIPRIDPSGERLFTRPGATAPYATTPYGEAPVFNPNQPGATPPLPGTTVIAPPVYSAPETPAPSALPPGVSSPMVQSPFQTPQPAYAPPTTTPALIPPPATGSYTVPASASPSTTPAPSLLGGGGQTQPGLTLHPSRLVAIVGSEVVMLASLCGSDGYMVTGENVEWMIDRDSVGSFVSPGERGTFECLNRWRGLPKKVDNSYVLNTTIRKQHVLDRGTPVTFDDIRVEPGQAWVTVTSPAEGTTHLTAFAPHVPQWDRRQQSATIYWVDAQWDFPPPAINPVGTKHTFVTGLNRQTDGSPIAGWIVRYEIVGGPAAQWEPSGGNVIEVITNELGQAAADLVQLKPAPGTNIVNVQIVRPPDAGSGRKVVIGSGTTQKTWTQSNICIETIGPLQATVGATVNYRLEASNPSSATVRNVVVTDQPPRALTLSSSSPTADSSPSGQEWKLGDLGPGQRKVIEIYYKVNQAGNFNYCATVTAEGGLTATDCITTNAEGTETRPIDVQVTGPTAAQVGSRVEYTVEVTNIGNSTASGLVVMDTFDAGLEHSASASPIERNIDDIPAGRSTRFTVEFQVTRPGQQCQLIEVRSGGRVLASSRTCLQATGTTAPPSNPRFDDEDSVTRPNTRNRLSQPLPGATAGPSFSVKKTGPTRGNVGEIVRFEIEVVNTGSTVLSSVRIEDNYDTTLQPTQASEDNVISRGSIVWTINQLEPGRGVKKQVDCRCLRPVASACNRVSVNADGLERQGAESCLEIIDGNEAHDSAPPPISAPLRADGFVPREPRPLAPHERLGAQTGLVVTVTEQTDPVRIGGRTTYDIVVSNKSESSIKTVRMFANMPRTMTYDGGEGRTQSRLRDNVLEWDPIAELRAGESVTFKINCRAAEAGEGRLVVNVTGDGQQNAVQAEESTLVTQ